MGKKNKEKGSSGNDGVSVLKKLQKKGDPASSSSLFSGLASVAMRWVRNVLVFFFVSTFLAVLLFKYVPVYITPLMVIRTVEQITSDEELRLMRGWVSINQISPKMVRAVVASEDNQFLKHDGFDFDAIKKARELNKKGGKLYGASTISQQTAKNVFLWPGRSWLRKGLEAYFTVLIELFWSKERIMEVYLNVIETGPGIYGVQSASEVYFHKNASDLTSSEAALIAVILPNPRIYSPVNPSRYILNRRNKIVRVMSLIGPVEFDDDDKFERKAK